MARKLKYSYEQKVQGYEEYLNGKKSASRIAQELSMSKHGWRSINEWTYQYEATQ